MHTMKSDRALFIYRATGFLQGMSAIYVDDLLRLGTRDFRKKCRLTNKEFETADDSDVPM